LPPAGSAFFAGPELLQPSAAQAMITCAAKNN
jgi:hypothetical protein